MIADTFLPSRVTLLVMLMVFVIVIVPLNPSPTQPPIWMAARRLASSGELTTLVGPPTILSVGEAIWLVAPAVLGMKRHRKSASFAKTSNDLVFMREPFRQKALAIGLD